MLLHCTVDSLGKTIRSVPAGHEPKLHGQNTTKIHAELASWMQLDVANITGRFKRNSGVHQKAVLVARSGPNACKQVAKKQTLAGK
jgi:hypothetical protein